MRANRESPRMITDVAVFSLTIAVVFFLAVAFYESLSTRDVLVAPAARLVRRFTDNRSVAGVAYLITVFAFIPILVALWAIVLEAALVAFGTPDPLSAAESAVAIVAAARLLAYVRQKTSRELAKLNQLALALTLLIGGFSQLEDNLQGIMDDPFRTDLTAEMITFLVALEIGLRLATDAIRRVVGVVAARRQRSLAPHGPGEASEPQ
jgi:hypothetical protein